MRFADPARCPDCRGLVTSGSTSCSSCRLPLTGPAAWELFRTLQTADELLARLRATRPAVAAAAVAAGVAAGGTTAARGPVTAATVGAYPRPAGPAPSAPPASPPRRGMLVSGVPAVLLTLGAACLLVGSLVFLAIAWVLLGVGGRTLVLVGMTAASAAATYAGARRPLPAAAESFAALTAGLLLLVVGGASAAGWLADADGITPLVMGTLLLAAGVGTDAAARATALGRLVAAQLAAVLGAVLVGVGVVVATDSVALSLTVASALLGLLALHGHLAARPALLAAAGALGAGAWALLAVVGLVRVLADPTYAALWARGDVWPLLAATGLAVATALLAGRSAALRLTAAALAGGALAVAVLGGLHGIGTDVATVGWTLLLVAVAAAAHVAPTAWRGALVGPAVVALAVPLTALLATAGLALSQVASVRHPAGADVRLDAGSGLLDLPWVALLAALGVATAGAVALGKHVPAARGDRGGVLLLAVTVVAVTACYPVPLALVAAELVVAGAAALGLAVVRSRRGAGAGSAWLVGTALLLVGTAVSWSSDLLLVLVLAPSLLALVVVAVLGDRVAGGVAEALAPLGVTVLVLRLGVLLDVPAEPARLVALVVLGGLYVALARPALRVAAVAAAALLTGLVVDSPDAATWLAVHLTVVGVAAGVTALLRAEDRRPHGAASAGLLLAASWVRLADVGVSTPEAYTLPAALVLLAVGVTALLRDPARATAPALAGGLLLALAPTTLLALDDPATLRGLLVALDALLLVLAGAGLRWNAPLVAGAVVGALLLVRTLAPYSALLPPYVVILGAGALLVAVGVTWESRLRSLTRGRAYLARLR
ncbi:hypothetical protein RDV89_19915 [Nocardioides zeae]|uniref:DUF2157 domain-containing protein n=1 Tax=Nocardioides imazamoxiresistens TaxID=3231893 RepID=A0ABU3Q1U1_9ACTN|nr:hypothetical protein [Nocardioides zeae]MDT9595364.1 hypothetical protein [Nocardioides zeae]